MPRIPPELMSTGKQPGGRDDLLQALSQRDTIDQLDRLGTGDWTVLYEFEQTEEGSRWAYSALIRPEEAAASLDDSSCDLSPNAGAPGFSQSYEGGETKTTYERFGSAGAEPIVHIRAFSDLKPRQIELSEEFRHFHNLYHDRHNDRYIQITEAGDEIVVAEIEPDRVRVRTRHLRQYLAARQLFLGLFFDIRIHRPVEFRSAKAVLPSEEVTRAHVRYSFHVGDDQFIGPSRGSFSRLYGKRLVAPPQQSNAGVWPFEERDERFVEFVIGTDDDGRAISHSCDPGGLANYFGANEGAPHFLTPVWFSRAVLAKYYEHPEKYEIDDGQLRCGSLWGLRMDNDLHDHVVVYLGDLGETLTYEEQMYWRNFNVTPAATRTSETNFRRSFLAQFADASSPDHVFKRRYVDLKEAWERAYGWPLFGLSIRKMRMSSVVCACH